MKKFLVMGLILLVPVIAVGCGSNVENTNTTAAKAVEQGELALANMDYDKALGSFNLAIQKGDTDEKTKAIKLIIEQYIEAENLYKQGKIKECSEILSSIDLSYKNYAIKTSIDDLKNKIKNSDQTNTTQANSNNSSNEPKGEKKVAANNNVNNNVSKSNSNKDILREKGYEYLQKLAQTEVDADEIGYNSTEITTVGIVEEQGRILKLWDDKLNEIYSCLRTYMPNSEFNKLKQEQINWIKYRDKTAEVALEKYEGGSMGRIDSIGSLVNTTRERCYELVNNYMK